MPKRHRKERDIEPQEREWEKPSRVEFILRPLIPRSGVTLVSRELLLSIAAPLSTGAHPFDREYRVMQWRGDTTRLEDRIYERRPDAVILYEGTSGGQPSSVARLTKMATRHRCGVITARPVDDIHHARSVIRLEDGALRHVLCTVAPRSDECIPWSYPARELPPVSTPAPETQCRDEATFERGIAVSRTRTTNNAIRRRDAGDRPMPWDNHYLKMAKERCNRRRPVKPKKPEGPALAVLNALREGPVDAIRQQDLAALRRLGWWIERRNDGWYQLVKKSPRRAP